MDKRGILTVCLVAVSLGAVSARGIKNEYPLLKSAPEEVLYRVTENGAPFLLECVLKRPNQNVKYSWHKNGKPFQYDPSEVVQRPREGSLVFLKPTSETAGQYQCFASSTFGTASTRVINVRETYIKAQKPDIQYVKPVEGKPFQLNCGADAYPKPEISWRYVSVFDPLISTEVSDVRMTFSPEGTLYITSVEKGEANKNFKYVCLAKTPASPNNDVPLAEYVIEEVKPNDGKSEIQELYTSKDVTVKFGERTFIYCIFGGNPLPIQEYIKDGENVGGTPKARVTSYNRSRSKRLLIRDIWLSDAGTYVCVSNNNVSKPKEHSMKLSVIAAPQPEILPSEEITATGEQITIPCHATGVPAPEITWTFNAKPLSSSEHIVIENKTVGNRTTSDLSIKGPGKSDTGYYGCKVKNQHGELYGEVLYLSGVTA